MKPIPKIYKPSPDVHFRIAESCCRYDTIIYVIDIEAGGPESDLSTITQQDYDQMHYTLETVMEMCTYRDGIFWKMFKTRGQRGRPRLEHSTIIRRMVSLISFEIPGSYRITIELPEEFEIANEGRRCKEQLELNYCVNLELDIIKNESAF